MKYALISPLETVVDGHRIAQVEAQPFDVAPPFHWTEVADDVVADQFYWLNGTALPTPQAAPAGPAVPHAVTRFQARAALLQAGLLDQVNAMMADPATPVIAKLAWADAQEFRRNSPTVLSMGSALGLTEAQLDALFITAAGIQA